jgi:N-acylneuraminate cytidylyltransferase
VAFVFARGGSKGLPGKNIRDLGGKPLLAHSIEMARSIAEVTEIFVSTDSEAIASVAQAWGAQVIERPASLAGDESPEWLAWQHAVKHASLVLEPFAKFLSLPATAPLRSRADVESCLGALDADVDAVITMTPSNRNPWFNMVSLDERGSVSLVNQPDSSVVRRQDAPSTFDMTTVAYVLRPDFITSHDGIWDGRVKGVIVPKHRAVDIDDEVDFQLAQLLYGRAL